MSMRWRRVCAILPPDSSNLPKWPHAETLEIMRQMDALRAAWQIRYPFE